MLKSRRRLVHWLLGGGFVASAASFLYPVVRFMQPPKIPDSSVNEASVGSVTDFNVGSGQIVKFGTRPVLVVRPAESEWRAFSAICTHLDCTVQYREDDRRIWCACHNGIYDINGRVVSGPPPRPLEEFEIHIRDEEVIVSRRA